jgi:hypothetical protein
LVVRISKFFDHALQFLPGGWICGEIVLDLLNVLPNVGQEVVAFSQAAFSAPSVWE